MKCFSTTKIALALVIIASWPLTMAAAQAAGSGAGAGKVTFSWTERLLNFFLGFDHTLLHDAIDNRNAAQVTSLLEQGANPNSCRDGISPLARACIQWKNAWRDRLPADKNYHQLPAIFNALIMYGANLNDGAGEGMLTLRYEPLQAGKAPLSSQSQALFDRLHSLNDILLECLVEKNSLLAQKDKQAQALQKDNTVATLPKELTKLLESYNCHLNSHDAYWLEYARKQREHLFKQSQESTKDH